ncbi:MAG: TldD/PmbA family protein [Polyangiaceae bacterium]
MITRRRFMEALAAAGASGCTPAGVPPLPAEHSSAAIPPLGANAATGLEAVLRRALEEAKRAGASYADARIHRRRNERLNAREDHLVGVSSTESYGIGVRVIAEGAWGFSSSSSVTLEDAADAARRAVELAKHNAGPRQRALTLEKAVAHRDEWKTQMDVDPFAVSLEDKARLSLSFWPEVKGVPHIAFCSAWCESIDEWKLLATSDGALLDQRIVRVGAGYELTAKNDKNGDYVTRLVSVPNMQAGWEHVTRGKLTEGARKAAEETVEKLKAPRPRTGKRTVLLAPDHLWLTIHETIGHSTELDRALGYEANLAGTSFATPDKIGQLRYAKDDITFYADRTTRGGLATAGYDDDGVKTERWDLVRNGVLVAFQTTRDQAAWVKGQKGHACSYAQDHRSVPFQRMPNISLAPGKQEKSLQDLIADTDDGVLILGNGSWSIDQQRYNFQFGGQMFYEIKKGKIAHALRDVAYQSNTLEFWNQCDAIGGPASWELHGTLYDGKGEPGQSNPVSHGCPPARFRDVNVLDTGSKKGRG